MSALIVALTLLARAGSAAGAAFHGRARTIQRSLEDVAAERDEARVDVAVREAALERSPTGVVLCDGAGRITFVNAEAGRVLDASDDGEELRSRLSAMAVRVADSGEEHTIEVDVHLPEPRVFEITAVPLGDGVGGSVAIYVEDVSVERRTEMMRTDFVANASHELKTPVGAIAILAETIGNVDDPEQRSVLTKRLQSEALRVGRLVEDVLQLAETESFDGEFTAQSVASVLYESVEAVRARAEDKGITLQVGEIEDAEILADRGQVVSAVRNLLDNAITYTAAKDSGGGVVRLRARVDGDDVRIEVQDTGIGIPEQYTDRIFERFFRVDRLRSRQSGGTGLGLSIVRNVVVAHGGSVAVRSTVGVGSTFTIRLPRMGGGSP